RQFGQLGGLWWERGQPVRLRMQAAKPAGFADDPQVDWLEQPPSGRSRGPCRTMPEPASPTPPLLSAHALRFSRNDAPVFGPVDFEVAAGEALLVQGDNGAGKTTLLKVLAGLLRAESGDIRLQGRAVDDA